MRRRLGSVLFVGVIGLLACPVYAERIDNDSESATTATVTPARSNLPTAGLRDEATMILVGTALLGVAAAMRRTA